MAAQDDARSKSDVPSKWSIDRLDALEKRFSYVAAVAAAAFGASIYFEESAKHHLKLAKNQLSPQTTLVIGIVAALLLVIATRVGRRAPVGFVALITGAAFQGSSVILGLPFFALAIWILYHAYKTQKETAAAVRAARAEARTSTSAHNRPVPTARGARPRGRSKGPATPAPNKRYTPKTPTRPAPPPPKASRRERKQAAGSE